MEEANVAAVPIDRSRLRAELRPIVTAGHRGGGEGWKEGGGGVWGSRKATAAPPHPHGGAATKTHPNILAIPFYPIFFPPTKKNQENKILFPPQPKKTTRCRSDGSGSVIF